MRQLITVGAISLFGILAGCGGDDKTETVAGPSCGTGTILKANQCLPEAAATVCGAGTKLEGTSCVPDGAVVPPAEISCGTGTIEKDKTCVIDPATVPVEITCGIGTVKKDGACELDPNAVSNLACGDGTVEEGGKCMPIKGLIDGFKITRLDIVPPAGGKLLVTYPVTVELAFTAKSSFLGQLLVVLSNRKEGQTQNEAFTCFLGGMKASHPGDGTEMVITETFNVTKSCLYGSAEKPAPTGEFKLYPAVLFNPQLDVTDGKEAHSFNPGSKDLDGCKSGVGTGDCTYEFALADPPGVDVRLDDIKSNSSVVVLQTVPDSIVKTSTGDLIYGPPEISMNLTVLAYGTAVVDEKGEPLNVLGDEAMKVVYDIRPADAAEGEEWQPIFLHEEGEPAKAGDEILINSLNEATEPEVVAQAPHYMNHGLYVEDHCGTPCGSPICPNNGTCKEGGYCVLDPAKGLDPDDGGCDATQAARTWITSGKWKDKNKFTVRACLSAGVEASKELAFTENNCAYEDVMIVRVDTEEPTQGDGTGGSMYGVGWMGPAWSTHWNNSIGGGVVGLAYGVNMETGYTLWYPRFATDNEAYVTATSDYIGNFDIIRGWVKGHAAVDNGYSYDIGLRLFGQDYWTASDAVTWNPAEKSWSGDQSYSKSWGKTFYFWVGPIPLSVEFGVTGSFGIQFGLDFKAQWDGGSVGKASVHPWAKPYAGASAYGNAGVNIGLASAGIGVSLNIITGALPLDLDGEITVNGGEGTAHGSIGINLGLELSTLSGSVYLWAKHWWVECGGWWCWTTEKYYDYTLASWSGYSWYYSLYSYSWNF